ncbi:MAG: hypothetical protein HY821_12695 [Acidobacteria bacterium]|nr:hypothetical protein [Acidobacteriota bacterium]
MIHLSPRRWALAFFFALLLAAGLAFYLLRTPSSDQLLSFLPPSNRTTLYADLSLLRRAGVLQKLAGQAGAEEPDYLKFVSATAFDYRKDLDRLVLQFTPTQTHVIAAGRFQFDRLRAYALASGGRCSSDLCSLQGSAPDRQISWQPLARNILGLSSGPDPLAATTLTRQSSRALFPIPQAALWLYLPASELHPREGLPPGASAFLSALEGASWALLSVEAGSDGKSYSLKLDAPAASREQAGQIVARLSDATQMLKRLLSREGHHPDPADLSGILAAGNFWAESTTVRGQWPIPPAFLDRLGR